MITFAELGSQASHSVVLMQENAAKSLFIVACMWVIHLLNVFTGKRLNMLGIWPRHLSGLKGIIFSPFLHADVNHLFFNSIPLFLLTDFMFVAVDNGFWLISALIIGLGGLLTWLIGRSAIHIGASALIMGYWGFLLTVAIYQPTAFNIVIGFVMLYYLGGLFLNLFPSGENVSFEGHICGLVAGIAIALLWLQSNGHILPYVKQLVIQLTASFMPIYA